MSRPNRSSAFTLIELLIVVAIIAILAAIAVPNFLEAQTRSKVSRVKSELRTLALALETYHSDANAFPQAILLPPPLRLIPVTTPIAYVSVLPQDIFRVGLDTGGPFRSLNFRYGAMPPENASRWILASIGPDRQSDIDPIEFYPGNKPGLYFGQVSGFDYTLYDPTNGTISRGDIVRASDFVMN